MRLILTAMLLTASFGFVGAQAPDLSKMDIVERALPDGPVALVRGEGIEKSRFLSLYRTELAAARLASGNRELPEEARVRIGIGCVTEMIQRKILLQEAARRKITVSDSEVEAAYQADIKRLQEEYKRRNQQDISEQEILEKAGQKKSDAISRLRDIALVDKVRAVLAKENNVNITNEMIRDFYGKNSQLFNRGGKMRLRQVFVRPKPNGREASEKNWAAAEKRIQEAQARIRAGETFAAVAKAVSDATDKERGGDMGAIPADQLPPFYVEAASKLAPGAISDIIKSEHGYHIIRLEEQSDASSVSLEEAREWIVEVLTTNETEKLVDAFCQPIAQDPGAVQIFLDLERSLSRYLDRGEEG